ncbi:hypothetical protein [Vibrio sp. YIC-376]|uniref:hypothetical protein n=1 Tax=Vibrio sp. YIC-376 TaxID=3136162 RepID=UPI00402AFC49
MLYSVYWKKNSAPNKIFVEAGMSNLDVTEQTISTLNVPFESLYSTMPVKRR